MTTALRYDPWFDLADRWPEVDVVIESLSGRLLGELRYPVIVLRADTSAAQRRSTLTHEIVHLDRGVVGCGIWSPREEQLVEREAARRLIGTAELERALHELGGDADFAALAHLLDVDGQLLRARLATLTPAERRRVGPARQWFVA